MCRIVLSLLILIAITPEALACSCLPWPPPLDALEEASAVFTGRITRAELTQDVRGRDYTIEIHSVWKGVFATHTVVNTGDVAMCGLMMEVGKTYLVYAYGELDGLFTHNCSRSRELHLAAEDIAALGEPITVSETAESLSAMKARYE